MKQFDLVMDPPRLPSLTQRAIDQALASAKRPEIVPRFYVSAHGMTLDQPHFSFTDKDRAMDFADHLFGLEGWSPWVFALYSDGPRSLWDHPGAYSYQS